MVPLVRVRPAKRFEAMALAAAAVAAVGLASPVRAEPPVWVARFNQGSTDAYADATFLSSNGAAAEPYSVNGAHAVATDAVGNVYAAGSVELGSGQKDFLVVKYDAAGNLVWYRTTDGGSQLRDTAYCIAVSADAVFVTGESCINDNCDPDFLTVKYDAASGAQRWAQRTDGPGHEWDERPCVAVDGTGNPVIAGTTHNPSSDLRDIMTVRYDGDDGSELWRSIKTTPGGFSNDEFDALAIGADGDVVVVGTGSGSPLTVKYNVATGGERWYAWNITLTNARLTAVKLDAASNPIVAGQTDNTTDSKFLTIKYRANDGFELWKQNVNYALSGPELVYDLALDGAGNAFVTGRSKPFSSHGTLTVKYEAGLGTQLWLHNQNTGLPDDHYVPTAIAFNAANNRVVTTGYHQVAGGHDFFTQSLFAPNGNTAPVQVLRNVLAEDYAVAVATDPAGNVVIAGRSLSATFPTVADLRVVKYGPALAEIWTAKEPPIESHEVVGSLTPPQLGRKKVAIDAIGNSVVVGSTAASASTRAADFLIQKYGPGGNLVWTRTVDGGFGADVATAVVLDGAGNPYVTGWSMGNGTSYDMLTLRLNGADGTTVWSRRYNSIANATDAAYAITIGAERVFVGGTSNTGAEWNATVVGYRLADGLLPWVTPFIGSNTIIHAMAVGCHTFTFNFCQEGIYATGSAYDLAAPGSGNDFLVMLLEASDGSPIWGGPLQATGDEVGYGIAVHGKPATVVMTGRQDGDWLTAAYQGTSAGPIWTARRDFDAREDQAFDVAFDLAGNAFVTGFSTKLPARNQQVTTIKYGPTGTELNVSSVGPIDEDLIGYGVAADFAGRVYVAGARYSLASKKHDFLFYRYTNGLALIGGEYFDSGGSDDLGTALAVERNSGDAVVAGTASGTSAAGDFLVAKYRTPEQGRFFTLNSCRLYDSRNDPAGPLSGGQTRVISAMGFVGSCALLTPAVKSLAINVTALGATAGGNFQLFPGNLGTPGTSVINFAAGQTRANNAILGLATNAAGTFAIRAGLPAGNTAHVVVDVSGYFD